MLLILQSVNLDRFLGGRDLPRRDDRSFGLRTIDALGDLKSLLILFGLVLLAVLFVLSLAATVGMISFTLSGQALEIAPALAFGYGFLALIFGVMFVGLLYRQVQFLRGKGPEPRG